MKTLYFVEPNFPCEFGEYRVTIEKHGEFHRCIGYTNMSNASMIDVVSSLRKRYPSIEGYRVTW